MAAQLIAWQEPRLKGFNRSLAALIALVVFPYFIYQRFVWEFHRNGSGGIGDDIGFAILVLLMALYNSGVARSKIQILDDGISIGRPFSKRFYSWRNVAWCRVMTHPKEERILFIEMQARDINKAQPDIFVVLFDRDAMNESALLSILRTILGDRLRELAQ